MLSMAAGLHAGPCTVPDSQQLFTYATLLSSHVFIHMRKLHAG